MAEENQRMTNQIVELTNARIENNDDHNEGLMDEEHNSDPTHVSETQWQEEDRQADKDDELDNVIDGHALDWFCSLPTDSISHFQKLAKLYEDQFAASSIYLHDSDYLNIIKQGQNESLKGYITRFTKVAITIPDLHPEVHLHAIKSRFRPEKFQEAITVAKPKTLAEFWEKDKGQMKIEELRQARKSEKTHNNKDKDKSRDNKKTFKLTPYYDSYIQFNTKREEIIKEILNAKLIKPPRKANNYQDMKNIDKFKYCTFHQKHGHTTDGVSSPKTC
ncbi:uncharacterized protein [Arachis hypogaea]|uniref:uncharacterized protein n=1 Tax=Arachis hypogaea TaxID=3818 RepID=UPI003B228C17